MRIKNLGVSEVRFKKTRLLHLGNVENDLIRNFLRNGRSPLDVAWENALV